MPLPRSIARVNRRVTNRLLGGLAQRLPACVGFEDEGHGVSTAPPSSTSSGEVKSPHHRPDLWPNADWVRNVLANGGCTLETQGANASPSGRPRRCSTTSVRYVSPVHFVLGMVQFVWPRTHADDDGRMHEINAA